jgi:hypothetical protein
LKYRANPAENALLRALLEIFVNPDKKKPWEGSLLVEMLYARLFYASAVSEPEMRDGANQVPSLGTSCKTMSTEQTLWPRGVTYYSVEST